MTDEMIALIDEMVTHVKVDNTQSASVVGTWSGELYLQACNATGVLCIAEALALAAAHAKDGQRKNAWSNLSNALFESLASVEAVRQ